MTMAFYRRMEERGNESIDARTTGLHCDCSLSQPGQRRSLAVRRVPVAITPSHPAG